MKERTGRGGKRLDTGSGKLLTKVGLGPLDQGDTDQESETKDQESVE